MADLWVLPSGFLLPSVAIQSPCRSVSDVSGGGANRREEASPSSLRVRVRRYYWNASKEDVLWDPPPGVRVLWAAEKHPETGKTYYWNKDVVFHCVSSLFWRSIERLGDL